MVKKTCKCTLEKIKNKIGKKPDHFKRNINCVGFIRFVSYNHGLFISSREFSWSVLRAGTCVDFPTGACYRPSVNLAVLATHRRNRGSDLVFCTALLSTRNLSLCRMHLVIQTNNWSFSSKKTGFRRFGVFWGSLFSFINIVGLSVHEDSK